MRHRFVKEYANYVKAQARNCKHMPQFEKHLIMLRCAQVVGAYERGSITESEAIAIILSAYKREGENE